MNSRRAWLIYSVAAFCYLAGVTQRTTIGVAGVAATERFHVQAAILSTLAVVQLIVYAGAQIPVGVLLDRVGPRVLVITGACIMTAGQLIVALAPTIGIAVAGRVLVGAGDAAIFISVVRIINAWFRPEQVPILSQWNGNIGQLGQIVSAVPFALLLHESGWTVAFITAAAFVGLGAALVALVVADRPADAEAWPRPESWTQSLRQLGESLRRPGTQLGFWSHFVGQCSGTVFTLMWGIPFLVYAIGLAPAEASATLLIVTAGGFVAAPVLGILAARFPLRRSTLVLVIVSWILVMWTITLLWPGTPPFWLIVILLVALGAGGPGSLIGFDFARSFNPLHALGSANGIVNVGGFLASFVIMYFTGVVLDIAHAAGQGLYSLDSFRLAFLVQYVVIGVGVVMLVHARRRTRRRMYDEEGITVAPIWVAISEAWARRRG